MDLRDRVRAFVREELFPLEREFLNAPLSELAPRLDATRARVRDMGLSTPSLPKAWGGLGLSLTEFASISEELGRSPMGHYVFNCAAPDIGNMELLLHHGSDAQQARWLRPLVEGRIRSCFGMTEPEYPGSNPVMLGTTAVRDGDEYVINGHKWFASGADGAAFCVVMAVTDPGAPPHARASQIIVPADTPGYRLERNIPVMGHVGEGYFSHGELRLEDCRVPVAHRIGAEGAGFALAQERLGPGRIHHTMRWIGMAERAFDLMCERAARREIKPGRPLATRQAVQFMIADSRAEIHAARLMVLDAAVKIDREGPKAARHEISMIKFFVANVLQRVVDRAIQVHGGLGVTDDTVLSFMYRAERSARIYDGPDEVHRAVVARQALKPYGVEIEL
jgi:alkylation response protein AidB-like acyl-CoA dehydrogenase